jgi:hypothetical protein
MPRASPWRKDSRCGDNVGGMRQRFVAVGLAALIALSCSGRPLKKVGKTNWFVDDVPPGKASPHLYWVKEGKRTLVDRQIISYAVAGCLLYETSRPSMSRVVFGALPDKVPVPVIASDAFRPFRLTFEGLRRFELPKTDENGTTTLEMDFIPSSDICSLAYRQPPFAEGWADKQNLNFTQLKIEHSVLDVNGVDSVGNTTLSDEVRQRHADVVDELITAGANVNAGNASGVTPLMVAIAFDPESSRMMQRLLDAGAEIDDQDKGGLTALMYAARYGRQEAVTLLLARGANPTIRDNQGRTAAAFTGSSVEAAELTRLLDAAAARRK